MVKLRRVLGWVVTVAPSVAAMVAPHLIGLAGISAVVVGVWGWLGWQAGVITAGAPFAAFYVAGQAIAVRGMIPRREA